MFPSHDLKQEDGFGSTEEKWSGNLELWHVKNRGRQAYCRDGRMVALNSFVDKNILKMDYSHSRVRSCDTNW